MTLRLAPILCCLTAPALAQGDCPRGPEALNAGVTVRFDGMQISFERQPDGRVRETERHAGEAEIWIYLSDPSGLVYDSYMQSPNGTPDEATRELYSYDFAGGLPVAQPNGNWTGRETALINGVTEQALVSWSFSKVMEYRIGACSYDVLWVHETRTNLSGAVSDPPWINQYVHLIELGLSVYLGGEASGTDPFLDIPLSISAIAP
jgi:hypothetical protein